MKLSIIIPVYNGEKTLPRLLDSILGLKRTDFEIIIVNDGSIDKTRAVAEQYALKDKRCQAYTKDNGGVSLARNFGIDKAQGEYIFFCDADDAVYPETLNLLLENIGLIPTDCFIFDYVYNLQGVEKRKSNFKLTSNKLLAEEEITKQLIALLVLKSGTDMASLCNKAFKTEALLESKIRFEEKVRKGEDWRFLLDFFSVAKTVYYMSNIIYEYFIDGSQQESKYKKFPGKHLLGSIRRKLLLNKERELGADRNTLLKWYAGQIYEFIYSYRHGIKGKELKEMLNDWSLKESVGELLKAKKAEYYENEISRKYKIYAFIIKCRIRPLFWILKK